MSEDREQKYEKPTLESIDTQREIYGMVSNCSMGQATSAPGID